ncbi:hypothetical protein SAMN04487898_105200 [Pedobacter sp. ok626]|uniref:hypothetical protein n=1 Tax=Pedobacter sp. ok626 TaxID=1761882 RepID=UPI00088427F9|nr:hypothetical protein [Pedobacter sp. ok626]SDJ97900.1 hypothetical protein SAMN04487898_105200 [Pedobacter sp. ok626]
MPQQFNKPIALSVPAERYKEFLVTDTYQTLMKSLNILESPTEAELESYDKWSVEATEQDMHPIQYAFINSLQVSGRMISFLLFQVLYSYPKITKVENGFVYVDDAVLFLEKLWTEKEVKDSQMLGLVIECFKELMLFDQLVKPEDQLLLKIGAYLEEISYLLDLRYSSPQTIGTLLTTISFYKDKDNSKSIKLCNYAIEVSFKYASEDITILLAQTVDILTIHADEYPDRRVSAFDAMDRLIRYLLVKQSQTEIASHDEKVLQLIENNIGMNKYLRPLACLYCCLNGVKGKPEPFPDLSVISTPVWKKPFEAWVENFSAVSNDFMLEIADGRFDLLLHKETLMVNFNNWTLSYSKMLNSIPHGDSILKEEQLGNMLLDLKHELTHVYSLFGVIGLTLNIMRWTLVDLEAILFLDNSSKMDTSTDDAIIELFNSGKPFPMREPSIISLLHTERSAEIENKIQSMEQTWTPWFEGLALYGEFADDPTLDPEIESPINLVMSNLIDYIPDTKNKHAPTLDEIITQARIHRDTFEKLCSDAKQKIGKDLLWPYLKGSHKQYLPGYLTVRNIVAKWRLKLGDIPLRGDQAFRILLNLTRFSGMELMPDLSLSARTFKNSVLEQHIKWLEMIADIDVEDLKVLIHPDARTAGVNIAWREGRMILSNDDFEKVREYQHNYVSSKTNQLLSSLVEDRKDWTGITDKELREIIKMTGQAAMRSGYRSIILNKQSETLLDRYTMMPLGRIQCPFWLIETTGGLVCQIRTRERDKNTGRPSYNVTSISIPADQFEYIKTYVGKYGAAYLELTRAVILGGTTNPMVNNQQYLIYQLGEWSHVAKAGLFFGRDVEPEAAEMLKWRFGNHMGINFMEQLNSGDLPCSLRTLSWIKNIDWKALKVEAYIYDLSEWANAVQRTCEENLTRNTEQMDQVSFSLLNFVYQDAELAQEVYDRGLYVVESFQSPVKDIVSYLFDSAICPEIPLPDAFEKHPFFDLI